MKSKTLEIACVAEEQFPRTRLSLNRLSFLSRTPSPSKEKVSGIGYAVGLWLASINYKFKLSAFIDLQIPILKYYST